MHALIAQLRLDGWHTDLATRPDLDGQLAIVLTIAPGGSGVETWHTSWDGRRRVFDSAGGFFAQGDVVAWKPLAHSFDGVNDVVLRPLLKRASQGLGRHPERLAA